MLEPLEQMVPDQRAKQDNLLVRREQLRESDGPVPHIVQGTLAPTDDERRRHEVIHMPPAPWCRHCQAGLVTEKRHFRADLRDVEEMSLSFAWISASCEANKVAHWP